MYAKTTVKDNTADIFGVLLNVAYVFENIRSGRKVTLHFTSPEILEPISREETAEFPFEFQAGGEYVVHDSMKTLHHMKCGLPQFAANGDYTVLKWVEVPTSAHAPRGLLIEMYYVFDDGEYYAGNIARGYRNLARKTLLTM